MEAFIESLLKDFERGDFAQGEAKLKKYIDEQVVVPVPGCYYKPINPDNVFSLEEGDGGGGVINRLQLGVSEEEAHQTCLLTVFEKFLNRDDQLAEYLQIAAKSPMGSICGKKFGKGDVVYNCRDCEVNPTGVLCVECFKSSRHQYHRYKITVARVGGFCDCGDEESWVADKYCELHYQPSVPKLPSVPQKLKDRAEFLFRLLVTYALKVLVSQSPLEISEVTQPPEPEDGELYCTVVYNDESSSCSSQSEFQYVISSLQQALQVSYNGGLQFATLIVQNGRCVVKVGKVGECLKSKVDIQNLPPSIETGKAALTVVKVVRLRDFTCQVFALKVLECGERILQQALVFREIFANIVTGPQKGDGNLSILEVVMRYDTHLWKSARSAWHHLWRTVFLMDHHLRMQFATIFSRNYTIMLKHHVNEEHQPLPAPSKTELSVPKLTIPTFFHMRSITGLSVQMFTVPRISHTLLAPPESLLVKLGRILCSEPKEFWVRFNQEGAEELNCDHQEDIRKRQKAIKCWRIVLMDMRYLLTSPPSPWTPQLEENFILGTFHFLKFLSKLQGIDAIERQNADQDYQPMWKVMMEIAFPIEIVITYLLRWCRTNKNVFIATFRNCLLDLNLHVMTRDGMSLSSRNMIEFANHDRVVCYDEYDDVSSTKPVSLHLPLSRFFASLYMLLDEYNLEFTSPEFGGLGQQHCKPSPEQLMEPALRAQVWAAQVSAGMWSGNAGLLSLKQLVTTYRSSRRNPEMMDKDILILQIGASLMEPDEFVIRVMDRFNLFRWMVSTETLGEDVRLPITNLLGEFLTLIINIFSARYDPKVGQLTENDCVQKAIIQFLCIGPMTHSELNDKLREDHRGETGIESAVGGVAILSSSENVYHLKEEFYKDYDWHYHHYNQGEMIEAEERMRGRKNSLKEPEFLFPPPPLPPFAPLFAPVVNILKSDALLKVVSLILQKCLSESAVTTPTTHVDSLLSKTLHLVGHGLNEQLERLKQRETGGNPSFKFYEACEKWKIFDGLNEFLQNPLFSQHHDVIVWVQTQTRKIVEGLALSGTAGIKPTNPESPEKDKGHNGHRAQRRAKLLERLAAAKRKFVPSNAINPFRDDREETSRAKGDVVGPAQGKVVALGPYKSLVTQQPEVYTCILCEVDHQISPESEVLLLTAFVQRSTVFCDSKEELREMESQGRTHDKIFQNPGLWVGQKNQLSSLHVSSCGHVMHQRCFSATRNRDRMLDRVPPVPDDEKNEEWQCPFCNRLCNATLPVTMSLHLLYPKQTREGEEFVAKVLNDLVCGKERGGGEARGGGEEPATVPLVAEATRIFSPEGCDHLSTLQEDAGPKQVFLTFPVWLRGMQILADMEQFTNLDNGIPEDPTFNAKLVEKLNRLGYPGGECFLVEVLRGRTSVKLEGSAGASSKYSTYASVESFMQRVFEVSRNRSLDERERSRLRLREFHPVLWNSLAYTIVAAEAFHRDQHLRFFGGNLSAGYSTGLKTLTRLCSVAIDPLLTCNLTFRCHLELLLQIIWRVANPPFPCLLELDAFGLLVLLTYLCPFAFFNGNLPEYRIPNNDPLRTVTNPPEISAQPPTGTDLDHHNLRLAYTIQVYQIIVSMDLENYAIPHAAAAAENEDADTDNVDSDDEGSLAAVENLKDLIWDLWISPREGALSSLPLEDPRRRRHFPPIRDHLNVDLLSEQVAQRVIPFLRCCAKFYECMTGIPPPPEMMSSVESNFQHLTDYLDLPKSIGELFESAEIREMSTRWSAHPSMSVALLPEHGPTSSNTNLLESLHKLIKHPSDLPQLIELPYNYFDLINSEMHKICGKCEQCPENPVVCLVCGRRLCSINKTCGRDDEQPENRKVANSAAIRHAYFCGAGNGIFVQPRDCSLLLVNGSKVVTDDVPYTDKHGEPDFGLQRGNALTLCRKRYDSLRRLWIQHEIPQAIARGREDDHWTTT